VVTKGYDRPAALFSFDLAETGLEYKVGDHLGTFFKLITCLAVLVRDVDLIKMSLAVIAAVMPRNPTSAVDKVMSLYYPEIVGSNVLSVEPVDHLGDCPFPTTLTARELLTQYLDLCGRPSRSFFRQLLMFTRPVSARNKLRALCGRHEEDKDHDFVEAYTGNNTYADVLCEYANTSLPPFEYLLSMIPVITPRLYSIASSPLYRKDRLDLLVVLNQWQDGNNMERVGLASQFLFGMEIGDRCAVQIRTGILLLPEDTDTDLLMFGTLRYNEMTVLYLAMERSSLDHFPVGLGTGVAPFRGFLQHREALMDQGAKLGHATLYVGFRHESLDYYLREDMCRWKEKGVLTALHPAFSHDNLEARKGRLYFISDLIVEKPKDIAAALNVHKQDKKVHVYYCGPAMGIPETIQRSMTAAISTGEGGVMDKESAESFMERLVRKEDRFHTECF
jgi:sulfite reductase alpha subunit-like flavoprotein